MLQDIHFYCGFAIFRDPKASGHTGVFHCNCRVLVRTLILLAHASTQGSTRELSSSKPLGVYKLQNSRLQPPIITVVVLHIANPAAVQHYIPPPPPWCSKHNPCLVPQHGWRNPETKAHPSV